MSSTTEQIKERLDIVDFIGQYVELKPSGSSFKALCPFHQEKTPSFMVSQSKQIFKCFGCGKAGDIFTFLQEHEGIDFREALRILANKSGVQISQYNSRAENQKSRLYDILKISADFYHLNLLKSKAAQYARHYVKQRRIDALTCDNFKLGYSPNEWRALFNFLKKRGFLETEMIKAGLIKQVSSDASKYYDIFRNRLMFPIFDEYSRVVGFGGRILAETKDQPKYINSPQTEVYNKSRVLYGLDKAKDGIRKERLAVLVEGYMDVIASHRIGVKNVVAASGTALTEDQLKLIKRFTGSIALAFDMDSAGIDAALRSYDLASNFGMNIKVVQLPKGKDPDDLIRQDSALWSRAVKNSRHIIDYYFDIVTQDLDISKLEEKKQARDKLLPRILSIKDTVERSHFVEKLAVLLNMDKDDLILRAKQAGYPAPRSVGHIGALQTIGRKKSCLGLKGVVEHLLALIFVYSGQLFCENQIQLPGLIFKDQKFGSLYKEVRDQYNRGKIHPEDINTLHAKYQDLIDDLRLLADKDYPDLEPQAVKIEFNRLVRFLNNQVLSAKRTQLVREIKLAEEAGEEERVVEIAEKLDQIRN